MLLLAPASVAAAAIIAATAVIEIGGGDLNDGCVGGGVLQNVGKVGWLRCLGRVVVDVQYFDAYLYRTVREIL